MSQTEELVKPVDIEKMPVDEANKMKALVLEDKAKYAFEIGTHKMAIAQLETAMAKCDLIVADLDRKVAGVDYPAPTADGADNGQQEDAQK